MTVASSDTKTSLLIPADDLLPPTHTHFMNNDHTQESSNSSAPNFSPELPTTHIYVAFRFQSEFPMAKTVGGVHTVRNGIVVNE